MIDLLTRHYHQRRAIACPSMSSSREYVVLIGCLFFHNNTRAQHVSYLLSEPEEERSPQCCSTSTLSQQQQTTRSDISLEIKIFHERLWSLRHYSGPRLCYLQYFLILLIYSYSYLLLNANQ